MSGALVELEGISKSYGAAVVLDRVDFAVNPGEVHVLAGENGAGKSTLIKILGGTITDYNGTIRLRGEGVRFRSPLDAARHGISVIHQELSLIPSMSVADNVCLADLPVTAGFVRTSVVRASAMECLGQVGLDLDPNRLVETFPIATQQLIEIAKALRVDARVVVMDEPTRGIDIHAKLEIYALIDQWKAEGKAILLISSEMPELLSLADRILVMHRGRIAREFGRSDATSTAILEAAMGQE